MSYTTMECLYCARSIPSTQARAYTCTSCRTAHEAEYGPDWTKLEWHQQLVGQYASFCAENERMQDALSFDHDGLDISAEQVVESANVPPTRNYAAFRACVALFDAGLGCRRIKRMLDENGYRVDVSTVKRWLRAIRRERGE